MKVIREDFPNINSLIETLNSRPNNAVMGNSNDSIEGTESFTKTKNWEEAIQILHTGYQDPIPEIKKSLRENIKIISKDFTFLPHSTIKNAPVGFIPNIPNSIIGLPNSMISIQREPQKTKTLSILYSVGGNAGKNTNYFLKAGTALVSAINLIEMKGISTQLRLGFMPSQTGYELTFPTVLIKNYNEKFNLQKICFPMIHPSMFRRIGFKYLETCPKLTDKDFKYGYGRPATLENLRSNIQEKNTVIINTDFIYNNLKCNIKNILKELGV